MAVETAEQTARAPHFVPARQDFMIPSLRPPVTHNYENPEYFDEEGLNIPLPPAPDNFPNIPYRLRKFVLRRMELEAKDEPNIKFIDELWHQRGEWGEERAMGLVSKI